MLIIHFFFVSPKIILFSSIFEGLLAIVSLARNLTTEQKQEEEILSMRAT